MITLIISIISLLCAFLMVYLAGKFSAMQDAVKHFPRQSIFEVKRKYGTTKKILNYDTGILYEYWYNLNGLDYLSKYEGYDNTKPTRKFNILGRKIHIVQICDGWHWWKMWQIVCYNLSDIFSSIASISLFIYLYLYLILSMNITVLIFVLFWSFYFWIIGYTWNLSFNSYYNFKLRKVV